MPLLLLWNLRKPQYKNATTTADTVQGGEVNPGEDVYEEPDKTAATTTPGKFKLTECPAYVATTSSTLQPAHSTADPQLQTSYYELQWRLQYYSQPTIVLYVCLLNTILY